MDGNVQEVALLLLINVNLTAEMESVWELRTVMTETKMITLDVLKTVQDQLMVTTVLVVLQQPLMFVLQYAGMVKFFLWKHVMTVIRMTVKDAPLIVKELIRNGFALKETQLLLLNVFRNAEMDL